MLLDNALRCVAYREVGRQSRRQKTERTTLLWSWHRVDRSCETPRIEWVDVPFGDAIAADALAALVSKIHVLPPEAT